MSELEKYERNFKQEDGPCSIVSYNRTIDYNGKEVLVLKLNYLNRFIVPGYIEDIEEKTDDRDPQKIIGIDYTVKTIESNKDQNNIMNILSYPLDKLPEECELTSEELINMLNNDIEVGFW